jgi:hypothetical protein
MVYGEVWLKKQAVDRKEAFVANELFSEKLGKYFL